MATATFNIPATDAAAATVAGYEPGGKYDVFRQLSSKFALMRPPTPATRSSPPSSPRLTQDILNGG